ncbi:MAG: diaminopimelate epimerase [Chloroflexi bacterium]|nr:diaminopimelate epimerase [Chloroflexota bacterium]
MKFSKYHALGNDYIVIRPEEFPEKMSGELIRIICDRNYGIGADGIIIGPLVSQHCDFGLRIYNPDGSEAEKSGNGLRIFARFLVDEALSRNSSFSVETTGGIVFCEVSPDHRNVKVKMGKISFNSTRIPLEGEPRDVLNEIIEIDGRNLKFSAATIGNPHCVVFSDNPTPEETCHFGPRIEIDPRFPNRTNVQFMKVLDRSNIQIEIWERGAGYTLASGSSSAAAAAVAHKHGLCDPDITVHMPGGRLYIQLGDDFSATMTGPVRKICDGIFADELFD